MAAPRPRMPADMAFTLEDLDRIRVRVGMGTKSLRQMSDTQFTAWLRAQGARGDIGVIKIGPGELQIPIEERRSEERRVGKECRSRWSPYH